MKEFTKDALTIHLTAAAHGLAGRPRLRRLLSLLAVAGGGFFLAALSVGGSPLPVAACLGAAFAFWPCSLAAAVGSCGGYCLFWGFGESLAPLGVAVLVFAGVVIFQDTPLPETRWFAPCLCAGLFLAVGMVFLLDIGFTVGALGRYFLSAAVAGLTPWVCRVVIGPGERRWHNPAALGTDPASADQLRQAAKVFAMLHRELSGPSKPVSQAEIADIYDFAAEQVCRCCVYHQRCWLQEGEQTYLQLCQAGQPMMARGSALREDFSPEFVERCQHMEGFLTAVNQALDASLSNRQLHNRLREGRQVLSTQYLFLSRYLDKLSREPETLAAARYQPDFAVSAACKAGNQVSGDKGACFQDRWGNFHVLLCDGMGTGPEAAKESQRAVRALRGLLEAGVAPDTAMELLNGFYVLQETTVFATMDLLQVELSTGMAVLYKWGAAPSYLKTDRGVEKIGTAAPPPGLCAGSDCTAQQRRLSLRDGETLILVSDGAYGEETEQRIASFRGSTARKLAGYLIAGKTPGCEDDLTAAVVRLQPVSSG